MGDVCRSGRMVLAGICGGDVMEMREREAYEVGR